MIRVRPLVLLGTLAIAACAEPVVTTPTAQLSPGDGSIAFNAAAAEGDSYLVRFHGNAIPDNFASTVASLGGEVIFAHGGVGIAAVAGLSNEGADALGASSGVAGVDPDAYTTLDTPGSAEVEDDVMSPTAPQTAVLFPRQWHMRQVKADVAWTAGKLGSATTKVGILDTGLGYLAADLAGRVDLANSVSFLSAAENARVTNTWGPGTHLVADLHYHGTHVGATVVSNAIRAAGVTSQTTLVGIKVCAPGVPTTNPPFQGTCPTSAVLAGVLYAADLGLPVINMSLGGLFLRRSASARGGFGPSFIATINKVFHYANKKGTQVVVASGNNGIDLQLEIHNGLYGAYCNAPEVICVSATGPTAAAGVNGPWTNPDAVTLYSNTSKNEVTVAAPGGTGAGLVWAACSNFSIVFGCGSGLASLGITGTSMASPHVAGLAALLHAEGVQGPAAITKRITTTADDLGPKGKDSGYGNGRINVARALGLQ